MQLHANKDLWGILIETDDSSKYLFWMNSFCGLSSLHCSYKGLPSTLFNVCSNLSLKIFRKCQSYENYEPMTGELKKSAELSCNAWPGQPCTVILRIKPRRLNWTEIRLEKCTLSCILYFLLPTVGQTEYFIPSCLVLFRSVMSISIHISVSIL